MKRLGKMIGSQETYTKMSRILKDTLNDMNNHYEDTDRMLEDAGFHQDQDFLKAEYKKHEQVMKHYDNIIKELKDFINTVDTDIDKFDKTTKEENTMLQVRKQIYKGVDEHTKDTITEEVCLSQNEIYDCIIKTFKEHGVFNIDAIKIIDKNMCGDKLCVYVKYCEITMVMVISNEIHYDKFIKHLDNFAEAASCRLFDINIFTINGITYIFEDTI